MLVRRATTANGVNPPGPIAALPNTGASPIRSAEVSAAVMPWFLLVFVKLASAFKWNDGHNYARRITL